MFICGSHGMLGLNIFFSKRNFQILFCTSIFFRVEFKSTICHLFISRAEFTMDLIFYLFWAELTITVSVAVGTQPPLVSFEDDCHSNTHHIVRMRVCARRTVRAGVLTTHPLRSRKSSWSVFFDQIAERSFQHVFYRFCDKTCRI